MQTQSEQLLKLLEDGKLLKLATFFEGDVDTIKYVDKNISKPIELNQIKLGLRLQAGNSRKTVDAIMRVKDGQVAAEVLANMNLKPGGTVILDVDTLVKIAPAKKGAESTWGLRIYGAYNLEDTKS